jgi:hypothetical protein
VFAVSQSSTLNIYLIEIMEGVMLSKDQLASYQIGLEIEQSDKTRKNIANLRSSFDDVEKSIDDINAAFLESIKGQADMTAEAKEYNKLVSKRLADLENEANKLVRSQTEQGQANRARLRELKAIRDARRLDKDETAELKRLEASVVDLSDEELANRLRINAEQRKALKIGQLQAKQAMASVRQQKTLKDLVKADLKNITDRIKKQWEFVKALKTTEGKYAALKKLGGGAVKGAKMAGKAAVGAAGMVGAVVGGAVASADNIAQTEQEARRMRISGMDDDEKMSLLGELQVKTRADSASIVEAVNRVLNVMKTNDRAEILRAAIAELRFPGSAALMQASGDAASADSFGKWENRMRLVQKATGASQSDLESAMSLISNKGDQWFKAGVSQQDLVSLYTALKGSNAFDSDEEIERAMRSFMASGVTAENFYDKMAAYDWSRHVWNSANKNQADNFRRNFDFAALRQANTQAVSSDVQQSAAEKAAETARRVAAKKDELVMRILKKIEPLMDSGTLDKIIDNLFKMLEVALPLLEPVLKVVDKVFKALEPVINKMVQLINRLVYAMENADGIKSFFELLANEQPSDGNATGAPQSGGQKAVGGIAIAPTIVGERGAEAIIPLDYARAGRAAQVMQNITQTFNMGGSQTTAMSLGQAVKQRSFTDNLLSNRLYGGR